MPIHDRMYNGSSPDAHGRERASTEPIPDPTPHPTHHLPHLISFRAALYHNRSTCVSAITDLGDEWYLSYIKSAFCSDRTSKLTQYG
jgi:hypothetical protein